MFDLIPARALLCSIVVLLFGSHVYRAAQAVPEFMLRCSSIHSTQTDRPLVGEQLSLADIHLAAWLARVASICDGNISDSGAAIAEKVEKHMRSGYTLPKNGDQSKIAVFWDAIKERPSFKKVYASGLY